ncbi:MAG: XRE family transcriptional regulator [Alphaproteobacteria bacterium]|nr:XRE family transcriptional regulator [Alphaproteobacteria bacterium]
MSRKISVRTGSDNIFRDLGFSEAEAQEALAKSELIHAIARTIGKRGLTQIEAAKRCRTDQPTLSKVLRGRMESVTIDKLASWLTALGRDVEIRVGSSVRKTPGRLVARAA